MYGEKNTFEDAKTTVTEFLDDFYDDSEGNYNQAFLNLERRLQEYFEYEPRDSENCPKTECTHDDVCYVVYMDGLECGRFRDKEDAEAVVRAHNGEHDVWIEEEDAKEHE